jgi:hypothetical protein
MSYEMWTEIFVQSLTDRPVPLNDVKYLIDSHVDLPPDVDDRLHRCKVLVEGKSVIDPKLVRTACWSSFELEGQWEALSAMLGGGYELTVREEWIGEGGPTITSTVWVAGEVLRDRCTEAREVPVLLPQMVEDAKLVLDVATDYSSEQWGRSAATALADLIGALA